MSLKYLSLIGAGQFGSALHSAFVAGGFRAQLYGRDFPTQIRTRVVMLAVPTRSVTQVLAQLDLSSDQILILCNKGLAPDGQILTQKLHLKSEIAVLSGPGFAQDITAGQPVIQTIASRNSELAQTLAQDLSTNRLRLYWSDDIIGVQACGALKNIVAIAAGLSDGLSFGDSTKAAIVARGLQEMQKAIALFGGDPMTVQSAAGVGDLVLTCGSDKSRNYRFGKMIAQGATIAEALSSLGTVEGLAALESLMSGDQTPNLPISSAIHQIIHNQASADDVLNQLMSRTVAKG